MTVIIAGSRGLSDYESVGKAVRESGFEVTEVVSGCAHGADLLGERWAEENGVPVKRFPADWNRHGKAAGGMRNSEMAAYAVNTNGGLIALWDGKSGGTRDMIAKARLLRLKYHIEIIEGEK